MAKLEEIVEIFSRFGKEHTPVGVIQNGTTVNERSGFGSIKTIEEVVKEKGLAAPAIIVIGAVVKESYHLRSVFKNFKSLPKGKIISA